MATKITIVIKVQFHENVTFSILEVQLTSGSEGRKAVRLQLQPFVVYSIFSNIRSSTYVWTPELSCSAWNETLSSDFFVPKSRLDKRFASMPEPSTTRRVRPSPVSICPGWETGATQRWRGTLTVTSTRRKARLAGFCRDWCKTPGQELTWVVFNVQSMSESALWVKGKTTGAKFSPREAG